MTFVIKMYEACLLVVMPDPVPAPSPTPGSYCIVVVLSNNEIVNDHVTILLRPCHNFMVLYLSQFSARPNLVVRPKNHLVKDCRN